MAYRLNDLFDVAELQNLSESFTRLTGAVTAILDLEGNILTATGWQPVCTKFHRIHPQSAIRCRESDTVLASRLQSGEKFNVYKCKNGLVDVAVPLIIDGQHLGNLFTGQFLFEPPDVEYFAGQADEFGYDKTQYFEALSKVPVFTREYIQVLMDFLHHLAEFICKMGLSNKKALDASEEFFSYYMDNIDAYVYIKDKASNYTFINKKTEELFNVTRADLKKRNYSDFDFFDPQMAKELRENDTCVMSTELHTEAEEVGRPEGTQNTALEAGYRYYLALKFPLKDEHGNVAGVCGFSYDITKRNQLEQEIRDLNRNLETRIRHEIEVHRQKEQMLIQQSKMAAMGEMVATIAHQWKQPLNALLVTTQDLRDAFEYGELDKAYMDNAIDITKQQIGFMSGTIDDFRRFLMPSKEKIVFDVNEQIREIVSMFEGVFRKSGITIEMKTGAGPEGLTTLGYPNEFKHVLLNLLNNSKDAILSRHISDSAWEGTIVLFTDKEDDKVIISVSDNGAGIPEDIMDRIFDPYFSTKTTQAGTGIGLYMSKTIIESNMGGKLTAKNRDGGAEFTVMLACHQG